MAVLSPVSSSQRRTVSLSGAGAWFLPAGGNTVTDLVTGDVVLHGTPIGPQPPWPDPQPPPRERGGICFDGCGSMYHGVPEHGQIQRMPWPREPGADPVDLMPLPGESDPPDATAGFVESTGGRLPLRARALATDTDSHLFVLDGGSQSIAIIDLTDGRLLRNVATKPGPPRDLVSAGETILVALASRVIPVVRLDSISGPRRVGFAAAARPALSDIPEEALPSRIALDPSGGLWLLWRAGAAAWIICCDGRAAGASIRVDGASDFDIDAHGQVVVAGPAGGDLLVFSVGDAPAGAVTAAVPLAGQSYDGRGIGRTPDGRIGFWTSRGFRVARGYRLRYPDHGISESFALDSHTPRQVWGRIFVEACVPPGTRLEVGYASLDELPTLASVDGASSGSPSAAAPPSVDADLDRAYPLHRRETGRELPWTPLPRGDRYEVYEGPVLSRPGRYMFVRLHLSGTATQTPRIRAARIECDSHDLLGRLPRLYREDPVAESMLRRYLAVIDGMLREVEWRALERDRILDPWGAPAELLPWLASLIGLVLDDRWSEQARRTVLAEAICLFRGRGTVRGLSRILEIYLGAPVSILEAFRVRGYGGAFVGGDADVPGPASAVVGQSFRVGGVGGSPQAPAIKSADAFATHAHRFTVLVARDICESEIEVLRSLLDIHRPAHTLVEVCGAGQGMRVGMGLHVELSTVVGPGSNFRSAVVGASSVGDGSIVGRGRAGVRAGVMVLDNTSVVDP